jgi:hypothetical protein
MRYTLINYRFAISKTHSNYVHLKVEGPLSPIPRPEGDRAPLAAGRLGPPPPPPSGAAVGRGSQAKPGRRRRRRIFIICVT